MNDLTPHQRDIMQAMLLGLDIEWSRGLPSEPEWVFVSSTAYLNLFGFNFTRLRIAPGQESKTVRLYGDAIEDDDTLLFSEQPDSRFNTCYIDISPNGFIVGGKL